MWALGIYLSYSVGTWAPAGPLWTVFTCAVWAVAPGPLATKRLEKQPGICNDGQPIGEAIYAIRNPGERDPDDRSNEKLFEDLTAAAASRAMAATWHLERILKVN